VRDVRVGWKHQHPDDPVILYSELDGNRFEVRKVEVFRNGRCRVCEWRRIERRHEAGQVVDARAGRDRQRRPV
jgi:hypothetical protein